MQNAFNITISAVDEDPDALRLIMARAQFTALAEVLDINVDLDVVAIDNDQPEVADLIRALINTIRNADTQED